MLKWLFIVFAFLGWSSEPPNYENLSCSKDCVFFLSTPRSGTNLVSSYLSAITRKPIVWFNGKNTTSEKKSTNLFYNRLKLPLVSLNPLMYRTHGEFAALSQIPSNQNKLIFMIRNPKELLFRSFQNSSPTTENPEPSFVENFLNSYLKIFKMYESWLPENRFLIYYEDFIRNDISILLNILQFINEAPLYWNDFILNKQRYTEKILQSYQKEHAKTSGGISSQSGPIEIYYTKNTPTELLRSIDEYIEKKEPWIWENYLKRFQTN